MNEEIRIQIDLRNMPDLSKRPKKVIEKVSSLESGDLAEIISDDPRREKVAPQMANAIGIVEHVKTWYGDDGLYHTVIRKK